MRLENEYGVTVVDARDIGSHAWGLDGPGSDYDVGVVYAHEPFEYAKLSAVDRTIDEPFDVDDIELKGWDVTKFAELLDSSNASAIEYLRSEVVYRHELPVDELRRHVEQSFNPISLYHDYRGLAKNNYRQYVSNHLVDREDAVYPIQSMGDDRYLVESPSGETLKIPTDNIAPQDEPFEDCEYRRTQTRRTVKRNLVVARAVPCYTPGSSGRAFTSLTSTCSRWFGSRSLSKNKRRSSRRRRRSTMSTVSSL